MYDAALGRWHAVDPMSEKYYSISSYVYGLNTPHNCIDPDGQKIIFVNGYVNAIGPEKHGEDFFSHYHPTRNHTGYSSVHIWFFE